MIRIRQIEINAVVFNQYNNGISEIIYQECTERAVDGFFYFLDMLIKETRMGDTIYLLSDLSVSNHLPLPYHYSKIAQLNNKYEPHARPYARFANIYNEMTQRRRMVLAYMQTLNLWGVKLNMYAYEDRSEAISWLLYGN